MNNEVVNFAFNDNEIRVVEREDDPWFVAGDVLDALGYPKNGNSKVLLKLESYERAMKRIHGKSRRLNMNIISEAGLYKLVMRSDKPLAIPFQNWVTNDVLPAIRKDGGYVMGEEKVATGELEETQFILQAMTMLKGKTERLTEENRKLSQENAVMEPKAVQFDRFMDADGLLSMGLADDDQHLCRLLGDAMARRWSTVACQYLEQSRQRGLVVRCITKPRTRDGYNTGGAWPSVSLTAETAYKYADAMLQERRKCL